MRKIKLKDKGRNLHHERMPAESKRRRLQKNWVSQPTFVQNDIEMELANMPKKEKTESNDKRILKLPKDCPAEAVLKTDSPCSVIR